MADIVPPDDFGVGVFADLTLELREVVGDGDLVLLDDHLGLDPAFQAEDVNDGAGALAAAGRDEKVFLGFLLPQADLALSGKVFVDFVDLLLVGVALPVGEGLFGSFKLGDHVLNSAQLDDITDF